MISTREPSFGIFSTAGFKLLLNDLPVLDPPRSVVLRPAAVAGTGLASLGRPAGRTRADPELGGNARCFFADPIGFFGWTFLFFLVGSPKFLRNNYFINFTFRIVRYDSNH